MLIFGNLFLGSGWADRDGGGLERCAGMSRCARSKNGPDRLTWTIDLNFLVIFPIGSHVNFWEFISRLWVGGSERPWA